ncbi:MAG: hypothetical protein WB662_11320 [Methyloceanibacter sp.]
MPKVEPLRLYGKRGCPSAYAIRDFLQRSDIPFEWIELRNNEYARNELGVENVDDARLPICIFNGGTRMERPTVRQITESWVGSATLLAPNTTSPFMVRVQQV